MVQAGVLGALAPYNELKYGWPIKVGLDFGDYESWLLNSDVREGKIEEACSQKIEEINFELDENDVRYEIPAYDSKKSKLRRDAVFRKIVKNLGDISDDHAIYFMIGDAVGMSIYGGSKEQSLERLRQVKIFYPRMKGFSEIELHNIIETSLEPLDKTSTEAALTAIKRALQQIYTKKVILFVTTDPADQDRLQTQKEQRLMTAALQSSKLGDMYRVESLPSCRPEDLDRAINDSHPAILHFSGHSGAEGLCFEGDNGRSVMIKPQRLADLLGRASRDGLDLVILNACATAPQSKSIADKVKAVIAMEGAVGDEKALKFTKFFYQALGAGRDVKDCFTSAVSNSDLVDGPGRMTPLLTFQGVPVAREGDEKSDSKRDSKCDDTNDAKDGDGDLYDEDSNEEEVEEEEEGSDDEDVEILRRLMHGFSHSNQVRLPPRPLPAPGHGHGLSAADISLMEEEEEEFIRAMSLSRRQAPQPPTSTPVIMIRPTAAGVLERLSPAVMCDHCKRRFDHRGGFHCDICNRGDVDVCAQCYAGGRRCGSFTHPMIQWVVVGPALSF